MVLKVPPPKRGTWWVRLLYVYSDFVVAVSRNVVKLLIREIVSYSLLDVVPIGFPHLQELVPFHRRSPCKSVVLLAKGFWFAKC